MEFFEASLMVKYCNIGKRDRICRHKNLGTKHEHAVKRLSIYKYKRQSTVSSKIVMIIENTSKKLGRRYKILTQKELCFYIESYAVIKCMYVFVLTRLN